MSIDATHTPEEATDYTNLWPCGRPMGGYRGKFPHGFLERCNRNWGIYHYETLFPFGGLTPKRDNWVVNDLRKGEPTGPNEEPLEADTGYDARDLPDEWTNKFDIVVSDPPYAEHYADDLYNVEYPKPSAHMREATRVCKPGGKVLILDQLVYQQDWAHEEHPVRREGIIGVTTGPNQRIRALNVFRVRSTLGDFDE